ncbi:hypothetical protein MSAN_01199000 [Mycena sanguinolenta]|uniref:Uncharacterized protein n=1 Tax=Mycena sanguinolenta TaxID=230812 RepID=A0A8H6YGK3_9AGAR|nr:hypothetical protein MSAN_01199000 [Mycena sanguinolenta]
MTPAVAVPPPPSPRRPLLVQASAIVPRLRPTALRPPPPPPLAAPSSTLAPDSTTTSELSSALGPESYDHPYSYHEQYPDALPFPSVNVSNELDGAMREHDAYPFFANY